MELNSKNMSADELKSVISEAEQALKEREEEKKKQTINTIKELAESIHMQVDIYPKKNRKSLKGISIEIKYRNPENESEKWSGRGIAPRWMKKYLISGMTKEDFLIK